MISLSKKIFNTKNIHKIMLSLGRDMTSVHLRQNWDQEDFVWILLSWLKSCNVQLRLDISEIFIELPLSNTSRQFPQGRQRSLRTLWYLVRFRIRRPITSVICKGFQLFADAGDIDIIPNGMLLLPLILSKASLLIWTWRWTKVKPSTCFRQVRTCGVTYSLRLHKRVCLPWILKAISA